AAVWLIAVLGIFSSFWAVHIQLIFDRVLSPLKKQNIWPPLAFLAPTQEIHSHTIANLKDE
ncbi:hypothetical protein ACJX0J_012440, partial [Zea mays]